MRTRNVRDFLQRGWAAAPRLARRRIVCAPNGSTLPSVPPHAAALRRHQLARRSAGSLCAAPAPPSARPPVARGRQLQTLGLPVFALSFVRPSPWWTSRAAPTLSATWSRSARSTSRTGARERERGGGKIGGVVRAARARTRHRSRSPLLSAPRAAAPVSRAARSNVVDKLRLIKGNKRKTEEKLDLLNARQALKEDFIGKKQVRARWAGRRRAACSCPRAWFGGRPPPPPPPPPLPPRIPRPASRRPRARTLRWSRPRSSRWPLSRRRS